MTISTDKIGSIISALDGLTVSGFEISAEEHASGISVSNQFGGEYIVRIDDVYIGNEVKAGIYMDRVVKAKRDGGFSSEVRKIAEAIL